MHLCFTIAQAAPDAAAAMTPYPGTQAIRRAVRLLQAFTDARPEWRLSELAEAVGLHRTTTYRVLAALEEEGLVVRVPGRDAYRLGSELIVMGARALRSNDLRTVSQPELQRLARAIDETVTLEVPLGGEMLILDEAQGPGMLGTHVDIGTRWPMHATSTGKALLAAWEPSWGAAPGWEIPRSLTALTPRTLRTRKALRAELVEVRERGYAVASEELQLGYVAVGAAVRNHDGRPVAAISAGGPTSRLTAERIPQLGAQLIETADRISRRLGGGLLRSGARRGRA